MKPKQKIISLLLTICLVAGLMPTAAFAAGTDTGKAIQLVDSGTAANISGGQADNIYFGKWAGNPIKWRVLATKTNTGASGLFLLSDALLGTGLYGDVYFDDGEYDSEEEIVYYSNAWQNSTAQEWCGTFYNGNFSKVEQGAVLETTKSDGPFTGSAPYSVPFGASEKILNRDRVFFLSAEEAENSTYGFTDDNARIANYGNRNRAWWLRSPHAEIIINAGLVSANGYVNYSPVHHEKYAWAARPAFNLDLNSVLFTSAAEGGKIPAANGGGNEGGEAADAIFEIGDYVGNEWKLTLLDRSRDFGVTEETASGKPGDTITLNYTGATTGENEYISVIIADNEGAKYYGRITKPTSESGTVDVKIPANLADGSYTLSVFSEQYNGGENDDTKLTDYASAFEAVTLNVFSDTTAPTLTASSVSRESDTNATVKFTSSEAGTYYYSVVDSGDTAPTIDTTVAGTSCDNTEQTISLTNLSGAGAKDIYIVVKDAAGNVSDQLKIKIPAYVNGGGGYIPTIQKPTIEAGEGVKVTLSADGTVATITVEAGYELADVVLNGTSKGKVTEVKGLKTGDKLVVTAAKKATEPTREDILATLDDQKLVARSKVVTMKNGKKAVRITWYNANGEMMEFDGVQIYRSVKRNSGYGKKPIFTSETDKYYNTAIKAGTKYYYKVRGFVVIDGQKYYTDWSLKAWRTVK